MLIKLPWWLSSKESACQCRRHGFDPWRRKRQPAPVFLAGKSHGEKSLVGCSPWDHIQLDTMQQLNNNYVHQDVVFQFFQGLESKKKKMAPRRNSQVVELKSWKRSNYSSPRTLFPPGAGAVVPQSVFASKNSAAAAAAAKSLQSCPTLCDPTDSSPPGSSIPGILQARTLEWVAISFSNA